MGVKSFPKTSSVTGEAIFATIVDQICGGYINKIVSVMADTTAVNTGKKSGGKCPFRKVLSRKGRTWHSHTRVFVPCERDIFVACHSIS